MDKQDLKHDPLAESIVRMMNDVKANWRMLAIIAAAVVLALAVFGTYQYRKTNRPAEASQALWSSQSPADIERVAREYGDTFAGVVAQEMMALSAVRQTNYPQAIEYYKKLVEVHPESCLAPAAKLAIAKCYVAMGAQEKTPEQQNLQYNEAVRYLKNELLYNRDNYAAVPAQLELVRVLHAMKRDAEAWDELQNYDRAAGRTYLASYADGLRETLARITGVVTNAPPPEATNVPSPEPPNEKKTQ